MKISKAEKAWWLSRVEAAYIDLGGRAWDAQQALPLLPRGYNPIRAARKLLGLTDPPSISGQRSSEAASPLAQAAALSAIDDGSGQGNLYHRSQAVEAGLLE